MGFPYLYNFFRVDRFLSGLLTVCFSNVTSLFTESLDNRLEETHFETTYRTIQEKLTTLQSKGKISFKTKNERWYHFVVNRILNQTLLEFSKRDTILENIYQAMQEKPAVSQESIYLNAKELPSFSPNSASSSSVFWPTYVFHENPESIGKIRNFHLDLL